MTTVGKSVLSCGVSVLQRSTCMPCECECRSVTSRAMRRRGPRSLLHAGRPRRALWTRHREGGGGAASCALDGQSLEDVGDALGLKDNFGAVTPCLFRELGAELVNVQVLRDHQRHETREAKT